MAAERILEIAVSKLAEPPFIKAIELIEVEGLVLAVSTVLNYKINDLVNNTTQWHCLKFISTYQVIVYGVPAVITT